MTDFNPSDEEIKIIILRGFKEEMKKRRNDALKETDKYFIDGFPLNNIILDDVKKYKTYLRNLGSEIDNLTNETTVKFKIISLDDFIKSK
jgi:hypothetical protein